MEGSRTSPPGDGKAANPTIRSLKASESGDCEAIMRSLPDWFGIEESIVQYRRDLERMETVVAEGKDGIVGFLTLNYHNEFSAEIHVIAIRPEHRGCGVGGALVRHAEAAVKARGIQYLEVKTLGPSRESRHYAETRRFYRAMGFLPLEENSLWGDANPCLIMVKHVDC